MALRTECRVCGRYVGGDVGHASDCSARNTDSNDTPDTIFEDDYCLVREHRPVDADDPRVAIQVGNPPEDATPTIVDGSELLGALAMYLHGEKRS